MNQALDCGILNIDSVRREIEVMKRQEILSKHPYKITQTKVMSNGKIYDRWITFVMTDGKRKQIKRKTKEEVEEYLIQFYETKNHNKIITFKTCYDNWLAFKKQLVSDNTVYKYECDYVRYFQGTEFENINIELLNEKHIITFLIDTVQRLHLTKRAFTSLAGYINEILNSAVCDKYISTNPYIYVRPKLKLITKQCEERHYTAEERTLSNTEIQKLLDVIRQDHIKKPYSITPYTIEFALLTGCRIGEIAALRWTDIQDGIVTIRSSEKTHRGKGRQKLYTIESTKTGKERKIPVTNVLADLFERVSEAENNMGFKGEFVFSGSNGRIRAKCIAQCMTRKCEQSGINKKSIHACRRTVNSMLKNAGATTSVAASLLGHTEEVNNNYYTYDISGLDVKKELLERTNILMGLNH